MNAKEVKLCGLKDGCKAQCSLYKSYPEFGVKVCISETACPDQLNSIVKIEVKGG